jgi:hypothetical protein
MEPTTLLIVAVVVLALLAAAGVYWYTNRQQQPVEPAMPPIRPQYASGGASYMITMGIGTPSEIPAFLLCGLSTGVAPEPPSAATSYSHIYLYGRRRR